MSPGSHGGRGESERRVRQPEAGGDDVEVIAFAALDHLGVAGDDRHPCAPGGCRHGLDLAAQHGSLQPLFDDQGGGEGERGGAGDGQIVDRTVDRQFADGAAGKDERVHHEGIGSEGQATVAAGHERRVGERRQGRVVEGRQQRALRSACGWPCHRRRDSCRARAR